ncbi:MAG: caspase family protein [Lentimicrobiaceae bacterium]|nr:caspase family protein [Lentimicrobiaceae bacterium]
MRKLLFLLFLLFLFGNVWTQSYGVSKPQNFNMRKNEKSDAPAAKKENTNESTEKFSVYAKNFVQDKINEWQKIRKNETLGEWQNRVNENTRNVKVKEFEKEAETEYLLEATKNFILIMDIDGYEAGNELYLIKSEQFGTLPVSVPLKERDFFKKQWIYVKKIPTYFIENDKIELAEVVFSMENKIYKYSNKNALNYKLPTITYNFDPIENDVDEDNLLKPKDKPTVYIPEKSDVDINIPENEIINDKTFAVIIANENYINESQVYFAKNDGEVFKEYCIKTLGIKKDNVHLITNATFMTLRGEVNWIKRVADAYPDEANIIFYYTGHGIPDEISKSAYLLPIDGFSYDVETGYKLDDLYATLGALPAKKIIVFLDACFSGVQRSGEMMAYARGVALKIKPGIPTGNTIVFSAAKEDETANHYDEKGHGLFTYFLLKKIQETNGEVTLEDLEKYIITNVRQQSVVSKKKNQTPTVTPAPGLENWKKLKLK